MGNWTETCILSKLPIEENEYCVMLVGKNLLTNLFDIDKLKSMFNSDPYPDMQGYAGNYNGRGTVDDKQEYEESIFVNWNVWNWLILKYDDLELAKTKQSYYEEAESLIEKTSSLHRTVLIKQYMKVSYSASLLRLVPNSIRLKGATEIRLEEFKEWLSLLTNLNNAKIKYYKEL
jgi:hypothetical protein